MGKRIITLILIITTIFSLSACMSKEKQEEVKKLEKEAMESIQEFLQENYSEYKIKDTEQIVEGNFLEGYDITNLTKFVIKKKDTSHTLLYNAKTKEVWSSENYNKVINEIKTELEKTQPLNTAYKSKIVLNHQLTESYQVIKFEDKSLNDILEKQKVNPFEYQIEATYFFTNKENFAPENIELEPVFTNLINLTVNLFNSKEKIEADNYKIYQEPKFNMIDQIRIYDVNYQDNEQPKEYKAEYSHYFAKECNGMYFVYNNNYFNVEVEKVNGEDIDFTNSSTYPDIKFTRTGEAYRIESEETVSYLEGLSASYHYDNVFGTKTTVKVENSSRLEIYRKKQNNKMDYYYDSKENRINEFHYTGVGDYASEYFYSNPINLNRTIVFLNKQDKK